MSQPDPDRDAIEVFVDAFRAATGYEGPTGSFAFGDSPGLADDLAKLVLAGPKRATAGWVEDEDATPTVGQHDVVLGGDGAPRCLIRTVEVRTVPFHQTDPAFAWDEGEGDRTLRWWRDAHVRFFTRRAKAIGQPFDDDSLVNLERFEVVWPPAEPTPALLTDGATTVTPIRPDDRGWVRTVTSGTTSDEGWRTDQLPALLARSDGRTAGVLVFHPRPTGVGPTEVVAVALLDEAGGVEPALRAALRDLARAHRWGHPSG